MASAAFGERTSNLRFRPGRSLQVEYYEIREIGTVFVFASEDKQLITLV